MPCAASPSAIAFTSSGCSLQNSAIWSNDSAVLSNSQTAVAFGISGVAVAMANLLPGFARPSGRSIRSSTMIESGRNIGINPDSRNGSGLTGRGRAAMSGDINNAKNRV